MYVSDVWPKIGPTFIVLFLFAQSLVLGGEDFRTQMIAGHKSLRAGQYQKALTHFDRALALRPDNPIGLKNCAKAFAGSGDWRSAEDLYIRYLGKTSKGQIARHYQNQLENLSDNERILLILYKLYELERKDLNFGIVYIEEMKKRGGDLGSAQFQSVVETLAALPGAPASITEALYESQRADLVSIQTRKNLALERKSYFWKAVLAINRWQPMELDTLYMSGQLAGAMKRYPSEKRFAQAWASLQFHQKKYDKISATLSRLPQTNTKVQRMLAGVNFHQKNYHKAILHWKRVPRHELEQPEWEKFCQSLEQTGRRKEATKEYGELYIVYPTSHLAKKYLSRLN